MAADGPAHMYDEPATCQETGLNRFETKPTDAWPDCGPNCDIYSQVQRGSITAAFNIGLLPHQAKPLNVDTYNQGCSNPWGCVNDTGYTCAGKEKRFGPFMEQRYEMLNSPFDASGAEYKPPFYMMGPKTGTANAVDGWAKAPNGQLRWQAASSHRSGCPAPGGNNA